MVVDGGGVGVIVGVLFCFEGGSQPSPSCFSKSQYLQAHLKTFFCGSLVYCVYRSGGDYFPTISQFQLIFVRHGLAFEKP